MPVCDYLHLQSFITKISKYEHVVDIPIPTPFSLISSPPLFLLAEHNETSIYNFTNPGAISHNVVLSLFKQTCSSTLHGEELYVRGAGKGYKGWSEQLQA